MAANPYSLPVPAKPSTKARRQSFDPKSASHSLPNFQLQCPPSPKPKKTSSGPAIPAAVARRVSQASLGRFHHKQVRIKPPKTTGPSAVPSPLLSTPVQERHVLPPPPRSLWKKPDFRQTLSQSPFGRSAAAQSKESEERLATAASHTSNLSTESSSSESKATRTTSQSSCPGRRLSKASDLKPRRQTETSATESTHDQDSMDDESHSVLPPTNRGSVFRRLLRPVFKKSQSARTSTPSLVASTSRARNIDVTKSSTSSSYIVKRSDAGASSSRETQGSDEDESRSQMMKALFLSLFMFVASILCMMAFFRLSDVARDLHAREGDPATTGLPTVAPPNDFVANIAPRHIPAVAHGVIKGGSARPTTDAALTNVDDASTTAAESSTTVDDTTTDND
ncbi:hypothetical protein V5799_017506 [Amblyomma americanum]|uniref:Uncharacterized protein n=1 Tax=Amblyomma americanum TaxID=6943 RepID=A0AAQ4F1X2_AMBAM